jgi:hypothetical protein
MAVIRLLMAGLRAHQTGAQDYTATAQNLFFEARDAIRHLQRHIYPLLQGIVCTGDIPRCNRYPPRSVVDHHGQLVLCRILSSGSQSCSDPYLS